MKVEASRFDFSKNDYLPSLDAITCSPEKRKSGKTRATLQMLNTSAIQLSKLPQELLLKKIDSLRCFTQELEGRLKTSFKRRYWLFGNLLVLLGVGPFRQLKALHKTFDERYQTLYKTKQAALIADVGAHEDPLAIGRTLASADPALRQDPVFSDAFTKAVRKIEAIEDEPELCQTLSTLFSVQTSLNWWTRYLKSFTQIPAIDRLMNSCLRLDARKEAYLARCEIKRSEQYKRQSEKDEAVTLSYFGKMPRNLVDAITEEFSKHSQSCSFLTALPHLLATAIRRGTAHDVFESMKANLKRDKKWHANFEKIISRYQQLIGSEKTGELPSDSLFKIAYYLELHPGAQKQAYIKKESHGAAYLPFSIHYNRDLSEHYISLKRKSSHLFEQGSDNKVTAAIRAASLGEKASLVAQRTTRRSTPEQIKASLREYQIHKKFQGKAGIFPIYHAAVHTTKTASSDKTRVSHFLALASGTLLDLYRTLSFKELLQVCSNMLDGLEAIHADGLVHMDVKDKNYLIRRTADNSIESGWSDFGATFDPKTEEMPHCLKHGFYGTIINTAPEIFGIIGATYTYEQLVRADIWALGLMLYNKYFKSNLSTRDILGPEITPIITESMRNRFKEMIREETEERLKKLQTQEPLTVREQFERFLCNFVRLEPLDRSSLKEAKGILKRMLEAV